MIPKRSTHSKGGMEVGEGSADGGGERAAMPSLGAREPSPGPTAGGPTAGSSLCLSAGRQPDANLLCPQSHLKGLDSGAEGLRETGAALLHCVTCPCVFPANNDRTVCKEIRHNSTGCLRMKDQCEKCQEILEVGESGTPWSHGSSGPQNLAGVAFRRSGGWEFNASSAAFHLWLLVQGGGLSFGSAWIPIWG